MSLTDYIIPAVFLIIFIFATFRNIPAYDYFVAGAKNAVNVGVNVFPYLAATLIAVQLFRISGAAGGLAKILSPGFKFLGIPAELAELILLRPFTGSGSIALVNDIYGKYGADGYIGRCASVVMASSETVFYTASVYFASGNIKKLRYALPAALLVCVISAILSCWVCKVL